MMLVKYNTCLGSIDVQERNCLLKGLFSLVDVSQIQYMLKKYKEQVISNACLV